jgi:hypothetical protein
VAAPGVPIPPMRKAPAVLTRNQGTSTIVPGDKALSSEDDSSEPPGGKSAERQISCQARKLKGRARHSACRPFLASWSLRLLQTPSVSAGSDTRPTECRNRGKPRCPRRNRIFLYLSLEYLYFECFLAGKASLALLDSGHHTRFIFAMSSLK